MSDDTEFRIDARTVWDEPIALPNAEGRRFELYGHPSDPIGLAHGEARIVGDRVHVRISEAHLVFTEPDARALLAALCGALEP